VKVVTVTATFRRFEELDRLFESLGKSNVPLHGMVVADNAVELTTRALVEGSGAVYVEAPGNLGCGAGLALAEKAALAAFPDLTHLWVLDDDVVVEPATLGTLLDAMSEAGSACPQAADARGGLNWFPGLIDRAKFNVLRRATTPEEYLEKCGPQPEAFTWATGVALLVSRAVLEKAGLHRDDFWIRGEDLDFSLRCTEVARGVYVPTARVAHLPPGGGLVVDDFPERMKHAAMLQNAAYLAAKTSHGRRLLKHVPGNSFRHIRRFGIGAIGDVIRATWLGAVRGLPAGAPGGMVFREKLISFSKK
jgi:GT2 family glycosyltransferase